MRKLTVLFLSAAGLTLAACATYGPAVPPPPPPPPAQPRPSADVFNPSDMSWSAMPGSNRIDGHVVYRQGPASYTCRNVALIPETPFSARRMANLYGSAVSATVPQEQVRARNTPAPPGFNEFSRTTTCDQLGRFSFTGLPDGSWFLIAPLQPTGANAGPQMAMLRRLITRGGRATQIDL